MWARALCSGLWPGRVRTPHSALLGAAEGWGVGGPGWAAQTIFGGKPAPWVWVDWVLCLETPQPSSSAKIPGRTQCNDRDSWRGGVESQGQVDRGGGGGDQAGATFPCVLTPPLPLQPLRDPALQWMTEGALSETGLCLRGPGV